MHWNKNGYAVTVRINLFAVGDGGGDLCTADPGSSHADIACVVVDYSAAIFLIPICISFDTAEKRRYATYLILNRRFSFEF